MRMRHSSERRTVSRGPIISPRLDTGPGDFPLSAIPREESMSGQSRREKPGRPSIQESGPAASGGVYVISVFARLTDMHPQTLRKYERLGLVTPTRSLGMLRLYSTEDIIRVRLIKYMVDNLGMNLAGVEFALNFLNRVMELREKMQAESRARALHQMVTRELEEMLEDMGLNLPKTPRDG
jgi:MerR family transcriptional regulator/heat shock protein HspR